MTLTTAVGGVAERLDRLTRIVEHLRAVDPVAERERVLQYDAVDEIRRTGVLSLRVPQRYGGPGGSIRDVLSASCISRRGARTWPRRCARTSDSRSGC